MHKKTGQAPTLSELIRTTARLHRDLTNLMKRHPEDHLDLGDRIFVRLLNPMWRNPFGQEYTPDQRKQSDAVEWIKRYQNYIQELEGLLCAVLGDVVTLSRDHIRGTRLEKRAIKNHRMIRVELPGAVLEALEVLPLPKGAAGNNRRFFSKDTATLRSLVKGAWRTMAAVFKQAGVKHAHPHRFRHTLASELLGKGGKLEVVAAILGDSAATISRYYAKWTPEYQDRQDVLIREIHGTNLAQTEGQAAKC
jgi:integrase-like protein